MQFNNFEDFFRCFNINPESGCDVPGGFQDLDPQLFILIGELLGNVMAGNMPFNIQNAIGNWLQLVGQAIETYNAQQQYFQNGPGRYYNIKYRNTGNPFTTDGYTADESDTSKTNNVSSTSGRCSCDLDRSTTGRCSCNLDSTINTLIQEIEDLKKEVENLKSKK